MYKYFIAGGSGPLIIDPAKPKATFHRHAYSPRCSPLDVPHKTTISIQGACRYVSCYQPKGRTTSAEEYHIFKRSIGDVCGRLTAFLLSTTLVRPEYVLRTALCLFQLYAQSLVVSENMGFNRSLFQSLQRRIMRHAWPVRWEIPGT